MINSLKVACVAALKGEEERGIWERESARGARGGRKRVKRRKGSRFQHPRALPPPQYVKQQVLKFRLWMYVTLLKP